MCCICHLFIRRYVCDLLSLECIQTSVIDHRCLLIFSLLQCIHNDCEKRQNSWKSFGSIFGSIIVYQFILTTCQRFVMRFVMLGTTRMYLLANYAEWYRSHNTSTIFINSLVVNAKVFRSRPRRTVHNKISKQSCCCLKVAERKKSFHNFGH